MPCSYKYKKGNYYYRHGRSTVTRRRALEAAGPARAARQASAAGLGAGPAGGGAGIPLAGVTTVTVTVMASRRAAAAESNC